MALADINWSTLLAATQTAVIGLALVRNPGTAEYYPATAANRALYGRSVGLCMGPGDSSARTCPVMITGFAVPSYTLLGSGSAVYVRVGSSGFLERLPGNIATNGDDIIGNCETDGSVHLTFGLLTASIINAMGSSPAQGPIHTVQTSAGDGTLLAASNVLAGTNYLSIGTTPSSTGALRLPLTGGNVTARDRTNTSDLFIVQTDNTLEGSSMNALSIGGGLDGLTGLFDGTEVLGKDFAFFQETNFGSGFEATERCVCVFGDVALFMGSTATISTPGSLAGGGNGAMFWGKATTNPTTGHTEGAIAFFDGSDNALKYRRPDGTLVPWKPLVAGSNVTVTENAGNITIASSSSGGTITGITSTGAGTGVIANGTSGANVQVKSLVAGANITITNNVNDITIAASGGGSVPTGTGFYHVTGGAMDAASKKVDLTASADITAPATASGVVRVSGSVLTNSANFTEDGSGNVTVASSVKFPGAGGNLPTVGYLRVANDTANNNIHVISSRRSSNVDDLHLLTLDGANNNGYLGADSTFTANQTISSWKYIAGGSHYFYIGSAAHLGIVSGQIQALKPITGDGTSTPWACHGDTAITVAGGTYTLAASEYQFALLQINGNAIGTNVDFPTPAAGSGYFRFIATGANASGTVLRKAGGGGNTVTVGNSKGCVVYVTSGGVYRMSADTALTP